MNSIVPFWERAAHDVAVHVTTCCERCQLCLVDLTDDLAQIALQDSVQLKSLPRGDANGAVRQSIAQIQFREKLLCGDASAWNSRANHAAELLALACSVRVFRLPQVTIVLLVRPVEFDQLDGVCREVRFVVRKFFSDCPAQLPAGILDVFQLAEFHFVVHLATFRHIARWFKHCWRAMGCP